MGWERTIDDANRTRWERTDGYATITLRETASGDWAVWIDRLQQAPDGPGYDHEVFETETAANDRAARWRDRFDCDG
ncbi:MAG: hypothetical protein ABEH65_01725 [Halobacteriales archaeon]